MPIPNFPDKHKSRPIVTPQQHVAYFRQQGFIPDFPIPEKAFIPCFAGAYTTASFFVMNRICTNANIKGNANANTHTSTS